MYEITVEASFSATHRLTQKGGTVEPLHGHDWHVTACLATETLDESGMVADFLEVHAKLTEITAALQYTHLNGHDWLAGRNPTAEHVARAIFDRLAAHPEWGHAVREVRVVEAPGCGASYVRSSDGA